MEHFWFWGVAWFNLIIVLIITIVVLVGPVLLIIWVIRKSNVNAPQSGPQVKASQSAKEIAQIRYAKGEISQEEYQQILSDIDR